MQTIQLAYLLNILILVPIGLSTLFKIFPTDERRFSESEGWRILVGALWTAILVLSFLGLMDPMGYIPILLFQVIYKSLWLAVYVVPRLLRKDYQSIPVGITLSFVVIVLTWPLIIPWHVLIK